MTQEAQLKVSVIIPVLNNAIGFTRCLSSVLDQAVNCIEVIVIDGGSTDGTIDKIKQCSDKIDYWESGKDTGISNAFNRGVKQASGDLIAILNSDDYWEPDTLERLINVAYETPDIDVYYGNLRFHDINSGEHYVLKPTLDGIERRMTLFHPSTFIRKEAYEKVGLYDESFKYAMDSEWIHRAIKSHLAFLNIPSVLANMSLGGTSDINFMNSLAEYRKSLIIHRLQTPINAWVYFFFFSIGKMAMRISWVRNLYRKFINKGEA